MRKITLPKYSNMKAHLQYWANVYRYKIELSEREEEMIEISVRSITDKKESSEPVNLSSAHKASIKEERGELLKEFVDFLKFYEIGSFYVEYWVSIGRKVVIETNNGDISAVCLSLDKLQDEAIQSLPESVYKVNHLDLTYSSGGKLQNKLEAMIDKFNVGKLNIDVLKGHEESAYKMYQANNGKQDGSDHRILISCTVSPSVNTTVCEEIAYIEKAYLYNYVSTEELNNLILHLMKHSRQIKINTGARYAVDNKDAQILVLKKKVDKWEWILKSGKIETFNALFKACEKNKDEVLDTRLCREVFNSEAVMKQIEILICCGVLYHSCALRNGVERMREAVNKLKWRIDNNELDKKKMLKGAEDTIRELENVTKEAMALHNNEDIKQLMGEMLNSIKEMAKLAKEALNSNNPVKE